MSYGDMGLERCRLVHEGSADGFHGIREHETRWGVARRQRTCFGSRKGMSGLGSAVVNTTGRASKAPIIVRFASTNRALGPA